MQCKCRILTSFTLLSQQNTTSRSSSHWESKPLQNIYLNPFDLPCIFTKPDNSIVAMKTPLIPIFFFISTNIIHAAVPCQTVQAKSGACVMFALGRAQKPAPSCCTGLQQLAQSVTSLEDKKSICRCLKAGAKSFGGLQDRFLSQLPAACHIQLGFPVSINIDCEK